MAELTRQHPILAGLLFLAALLSFRLVAGLWVMSKYAQVSWFKKLLWSCVALVPFVGPLFYGAFFKVPKPHGAGLGALTSVSVAGSGWGGS